MVQSRRAQDPRPSRTVEWHHARAGQYRIQCLQAYRRFRGTEIPWEDESDLAGATEQIVKSSRSRKVVKLAAGHFGTPLELYVKRYRLKTWYGPCLRLVRRSRAREEFDLGWALIDAGISTPRPVWLAEQSGPLRRYSLIATEAIPGVETVLERWRRLHGEQERAELLSAVARFLRQLHERGFYHDDCKSGHVLVRLHAPSSPSSFYILDLLGGRLRTSVSDFSRGKNLYQMLRHFIPRRGSVGFLPAHREIFLEAYGGSAAEAARWGRWVKRIGRLKGRVL
jgi:tRNA A-37 threonylcarbamoyl transferase component Bud32